MTMGTISISKAILEKYFSILDRFDDASKRRLIEKLNSTLNNRSTKKENMQDLFGAWQDDRSTDEIINDIKKSRVEKRNDISFE